MSSSIRVALRSVRASSMRSVRSLSSLSQQSSFSLASFAPFVQAPATKLRHFASSASASSPGPGLVNFNLADIGEGIAEVEVLQWFVKVGDKVAQFDNICEVQSDKATVPITSRYDGIVKDIKYKVGDMAKVGSPLLVIELEGGAAAESAPAAPSASASSSSTASKAPSTPSAAPVASNGRVLTSPAVRRLAQEEQVDLSQVGGTGPDGRILKEDVLRFLSARKSGQTVAASAPKPASTSSAPSTPTPVAAPAAPAYSLADVVTPISGLQRVMVQTMTAANAVPTLGYGDEIVMDALAQLRERLKATAEKQGVKLSYMPFILKAVSLALKQYPQVNAHVNADCTQITRKGSHNLGVAMDTPRGLIVPNIKNVQDKSIVEIARELMRLQQLGAAGKLGKEDLTGGTLTLSNIGTIGGTYTSPILVLPEVCIGALGGIQTLPRYDSHNNVKPTKVMVMSWSADHRVLDGATVARFSNLMKFYIENPSAMLLETK